MLIEKIMRLGAWLEYWGGSRDEPPMPTSVSSLAWGLWWAVLLLAVLSFAGQDSKFIYIDF
jgi:hypothetical protein